MQHPARVAVITGAIRGLGRAMALGLAQAGYRVIAGYRSAADAAAAHGVAEAARAANGALECVQLDITDDASCRRAVEAVKQRHATVDILVNNAAIGMDRVTEHVHANPLKFYEIEPAFWRDMLDVNVTGAFRMARLVAPGQLQRGWGRIVNISTGLGTMVRAGFAPYGPSKAALEAASAIWAKELAGTGVTVNVLLPGGPADTRMIPVADRPDRTNLIAPETMVSPLLYLVSEDAGAVNGQRFIANLWRSDLAPAEAARLAGAPVG